VRSPSPAHPPTADSSNRAAPLLTAPSAPPPQLKILKRDPAPRPASSGSSGTATPKTLAQREEEYRLARERIFGKDEVPSSSSSATSACSAGAGPPLDRGRSARGGKRSGGSTPRTPSGRSTPAADELSRAVAQLAIQPALPAGELRGEFDRGFDKLDARRHHPGYSAGYAYAQSYQAGYQGYRYTAYEAQTFAPRYAAPQPQPAPPQQYYPRPQYAQAQPQYAYSAPAYAAPAPHTLPSPPHPYPQAAPYYPPAPATPARPTPPPSVPPIQQRGGGVLRQPRGPGQGGFGR
jgi:hypothetical protein